MTKTYKDVLGAVSAVDIETPQIFELLSSWWTTFESTAKIWHYDLFDTSVEDRVLLRDLMRKMRSSLLQLSADNGPYVHWESVIERRRLQAKEELEDLLRKDEEYGSSWKQRGGIGAFMMLARKWDRLAKQVNHFSGDLLEAIKKDQRSEGIIDDIRDLRGYLTLVEAELMVREENDEPF